MGKGGHISERESKYHLTPDVLSEYLINREFFTGTILKHSFEELAKAENGAYIPEMLNSIIKIMDTREVYRKAAERLLEIVDKFDLDTEQKKRRIKTGIFCRTSRASKKKSRRPNRSSTTFSFFRRSKRRPTKNSRLPKSSRRISRTPGPLTRGRRLSWS